VAWRSSIWSTREEDSITDGWTLTEEDRRIYDDKKINVNKTIRSAKNESRKRVCANVISKLGWSMFSIEELNEGIMKYGWPPINTNDDILLDITNWR
jgi:hypothetical protein